MRRLSLIAVLLLAACSHTAPGTFEQPAASSFHAGPCRAVAEAVLSVGKDAHAIAQNDKPDERMAARLKQNQDVIDATQPSLEPALKPPFAQLVIGIGILRIRSDSNTLEASVGQAALKDYQGVVDACTRI